MACSRAQKYKSSLRTMHARASGYDIRKVCVSNNDIVALITYTRRWLECANVVIMLVLFRPVYLRVGVSSLMFLAEGGRRVGLFCAKVLTLHYFHCLLFVISLNSVHAWLTHPYTLSSVKCVVRTWNGNWLLYVQGLRVVLMFLPPTYLLPCWYSCALWFDSLPRIVDIFLCRTRTLHYTIDFLIHLFMFRVEWTLANCI